MSHNHISQLWLSISLCDFILCLLQFYLVNLYFIPKWGFLFSNILGKFWINAAKCWQWPLKKPYWLTSIQTSQLTGGCFTFPWSYYPGAMIHLQDPTWTDIPWLVWCHSCKPYPTEYSCYCKNNMKWDGGMWDMSFDLSGQEKGNSISTH